MKQSFILILFLLGLMNNISHAGSGIPVELTQEGKAHFAVIIAKAAAPRVQKAAVDLAFYLGRISKTKFLLQSGDGTRGIAVGLASDFPSIFLSQKLTIQELMDREAYILQSHKEGLYVLGATELAVEHAVWDLLYRLGYRQFFPGKTWEVIPHQENLTIALDITERPDYLNRRIWYGFGLWDYNKEPYETWCQRNRTASAFMLDTSHAYEALIRQNQAAFEKHPEYRGLLKGQRTSSKLCIGNPALRKLIADHAVRFFEKNPLADSISMDPSDGGGWCECEKCASLGSISDRALTLANQVAEEVNQQFPNKYVGMYAYNYHSPPPNIRVHPKVIISVATSFIKGGYSLEELIAGWSRQGATLGIREYYSVHPWDKDLPGKSHGSNLAYLQQTIPHFHQQGARFLSAESSDNWGSNGLGYYISSRILWDIEEAEHVDELVEDFLAKAFGSARDPMARFYELIDGSNRPLMSDDLIGRMYRFLDEARRLADTPSIRERINDLILYTRYVELYRRYSIAKGEERQAAFEALIRHGYRMRKTMMIHTKALYRDLVRRDKSVTIPSEASWTVPEEKNPWKVSDPFQESDYTKYLTEGIANHTLRSFDIRDFSHTLVPAKKLFSPGPKVVSNSITGRNLQTFYTWVDKLPTEIELKITGGLIAHYRNRGNVKVDLCQINYQNPQQEKIISHGESAPDGVERIITLTAENVGLHKITVNDGGDMTRISWKPGIPMTIISSRKEQAKLSGRWSLYFYVPKDTKVVGLYAEGSGALWDGSGAEVFRFDGKQPDFCHIQVPNGQAGKCWKFHQNTGTRILLTIPPCLAHHPQDLLLPEECIKLDDISGTFSIVAVDPNTGVCGAAVASRYPAVGKVVPYVRAGVGAFCTQHWHNPPWGESALDLLAKGKLPEEVLAELLRNDPQRDKRQLAIVDMAGRAAVCNPAHADPSGIWWGAMSGRFYTCQGNTLVSQEVIFAMARAYETTNGSLADRLMAALIAGDCAGGDHRGRLAAGIRVAKKGVEGIWLELYVDQSTDAVMELARAYAALDHKAKGPWPGGRLPFEHPCPEK